MLAGSRGPGAPGPRVARAGAIVALLALLSLCPAGAAAQGLPRGPRERGAGGGSSRALQAQPGRQLVAVSR